MLSSSRAKSSTTQSSSSSSDESIRIHAISKSDDGYNFMIARSRSNDEGEEENSRNFAQWDLGDGGSLDMYTGVGHDDTVKAKEQGPKVPSMKTLRKQHNMFAKLFGNPQYGKGTK